MEEPPPLIVAGQTDGHTDSVCPHRQADTETDRKRQTDRDRQKEAGVSWRSHLDSLSPGSQIDTQTNTATQTDTNI